ncbi:MAG: hypothetical protein EBU85_05205 [Actinobacteria bacterium]|nr:hypothetical protein [Actinomycetota bacterium]
MSTGLRVALVAPSYDCVPSSIDDPVGNGIRALADVLVARGHAVLVCAPLPSHSDARVVGTVMHSRDGTHVDQTLAHLTRAASAIARFKPDVTHDFSGLIGLLAQSRLNRATLVVTVAEPMPTMRAELLRSLADVSDEPRPVFVAQTPWVSQRVSGLPWRAIIEPAVSVRDVVFKATKQPFAVYVGPLTAQSGLLRAVQAAAHMHLPLRVSRRFARPDEDAYLANHLAHIGAEVEVVQSPSAQSQRDVIANARMLITTSQARDRAPHVVVRALASGTPVLVVADGNEHSQTHALPGAVWTSNVAELGPQIALELAAADPYECRRVAAVTLGPEVIATAYEAIYRSETAPNVVDLRTSVARK